MRPLQKGLLLICSMDIYSTSMCQALASGSLKSLEHKREMQDNPKWINATGGQHVQTPTSLSLGARYQTWNLHPMRCSLPDLDPAA